MSWKWRDVFGGLEYELFASESVGMHPVSAVPSCCVFPVTVCNSGQVTPELWWTAMRLGLLDGLVALGLGCRLLVVFRVCWVAVMLAMPTPHRNAPE